MLALKTLNRGFKNMFRSIISQWFITKQGLHLESQDCGNNFYLFNSGTICLGKDSTTSKGA